MPSPAQSVAPTPSNDEGKNNTTDHGSKLHHEEDDDDGEEDPAGDCGFWREMVVCSEGYLRLSLKDSTSPRSPVIPASLEKKSILSYYVTGMEQA